MGPICISYLEFCLHQKSGLQSVPEIFTGNRYRKSDVQIPKVLTAILKDREWVSCYVKWHPARICEGRYKLRLFDGQISDFHSWAYIVRWAIKNISQIVLLCRDAIIITPKNSQSM